MSVLIRKPSAWLPIFISFMALLLILGYVSLFGIVNEPGTDEGVIARIFQLLIGIQALITVFFVARWLPKEPKHTLQIFALQVLAAFIPLLTIILLENS